MDLSRRLLALRRRFLLLTALRWFPGGMILPVLVLLLQARGLTVVTIGLLFAGFGALVAVLELPTGGLADVLGRRIVFVASTFCSSASFVILALAQTAGGFAVAFAVLAFGRALSSGPLQAWYVDAAHTLDASEDLQPALSREGFVNALATGLGVVTGGALPGLFTTIAPNVPVAGDSVFLALTVPVWLAAFLLLLATVAIAVLMTEDDAGRAAATRAGEFRKAFSDVPRTIMSSLAFSRRDPGVRLLLFSVAATGLAVSATEVLAPLQFAALTPDHGAATALYGLLLTSVFLATGLGSALAPLLASLAGNPLRGAACASAVAAAAYALLGTGGVILAAANYVLVYLALGATDPLRLEQLHYRAKASDRSTVLSVESLAQMLGGVVGASVIPRIVERFGLTVGWSACTLALLASAAATLKVRDLRPTKSSACHSQSRGEG